MSGKSESSPYLLRRSDLERLPLKRFVHQHNSSAVRHTTCLTDALGFTEMGVHVVHLESGDLSSEHHFHEEDEEFIYVLSGRGLAFIGDDELDVGSGDFMAFPKGSPPHHLSNPNADDLVYLVGGTRSRIDICNYPRLGLRQYRVHGKREFVRVEDLKRLS
ncbi:MAG TPA: cupin domain-containing protein [Thermoanaerobaculia bacterium]|jgi:uncharacterized cupin superfamily protein|nr:cupin domain-containing protein [Thermoanaerobaculia bacterium]